MKSLKLFLPLAAAVMLTGCVSKKQLTEAQARYDQLKTEHAQLQQDYNEYCKRCDGLLMEFLNDQHEFVEAVKKFVK